MYNEQLVEILSKCAATCNYCAASCLHEPNTEELKDCISYNMDCAGICSLAASMLARGSRHGQHLLTECLEICGICAADCEKHSHMEHCRECAEACRQCEEACRDVEAAMIVL